MKDRLFGNLSVPLHLSSIPILLAPAKINLTLHLQGLRDDGYHFLESQVIFCALSDKITLRVLQDRDEDSCHIIGRFSKILTADKDFAAGNNSALKILHAIRAYLPIPPLEITIDKQIPPQAGLGGGSADAAAILRFFKPLLPPDSIVSLAAKIGGDGLACFYSQSGMMHGIGEIYHILDKPVFDNISMLLLWPGRGLSTAQVYQKSALPPNFVLPNGDWKDDSEDDIWDRLRTGRNDLTVAAEKSLPEIGDALALLTQYGQRITGFEFARMSGSGSACFALFKDKDGAEKLADSLIGHLPQGCWHWAGCCAGCCAGNVNANIGV